MCTIVPIRPGPGYEIIIKDLSGKEMRRHTATILSDDTQNKIIVLQWTKAKSLNETNNGDIDNEPVDVDNEDKRSSLNHESSFDDDKTATTNEILDEILDNYESMYSEPSCEKKLTAEEPVPRRSTRKSKPFKTAVPVISRSSSNESIPHRGPDEDPRTCNYCYKIFKSPYSVKRHEKEKHVDANDTIQCEKCNRTFKRNYLYQTHPCRRELKMKQ